MRYPKWFARWRVTVWTRRLALYRREWNRATLSEPSHVTLDGVDLDVFWERLVTRAIVKRVRWRKLAGVRLANGGPIRKGQNYLIDGRGPDDAA